MHTADDDNPVSAEPGRLLARAKRIAEPPPEAILAKRVGPVAPAVEVPTPGVVNCFRVFCTIVAFGAVIGAGCSFIPFGNDFYHYSDDFGHGYAHFTQYLALSLVLFTLFAIPLLFPRAKPWMWWYGLAIILVSTLSLYLTIFGVVLLIFWVQPRTQLFFGRRVEVAPAPVARRYDRDDEYDD